MARWAPIADRVREMEATVTRMRANNQGWDVIADSFGMKQGSLHRKFLRWRKDGLTELHVPRGPKGVAGVPKKKKATHYNKKKHERSEALTELLATVRIEAPWQERALCAKLCGFSPDTFFPSKEEGANVKPAKEVCLYCPVKTECLAFALENNERDGVWGGLSYPERRALMKRGRRNAA